MRRLMAVWLMVFLLSGLAWFVLSGPEEDGLRLTGCLKTPQNVTAAGLAGMPQRVRPVKIFHPGDKYRATLECSGTSLAGLLEAAGVEKKTPDGFNRPLDMYITVTGRSGRQVHFSYGEVFMSGDPDGLLLTGTMRHLMPHHHDALSGADARFTKWLAPADRQAPDFENCAGCHDGGKLLKLDLPKGICLFPVREPWTSRFVEDVVEISVRQLGIPVTGAKAKTEDLWVDQPVLTVPGGQPLALTEETLKAAAAAGFRAATFGQGRGYHGTHQWAGWSIKSLLEKQLPGQTDLNRLLLVVTASDGYRCVYSGGEIFHSQFDENLILAIKKNGQPLERNQGRFETVVRRDFYIDRSVHSVRDLQVIIP